MTTGSPAPRTFSGRTGCITSAIALIACAAVIYGIATRNPQSASGSVTTSEATLAVWHCSADALERTLNVGLRDAQSREGFHEENRALVIIDHAPKRPGTDERPVASPTLAWRTQDKQVMPLACDNLAHSLVVQRIRTKSKANRHPVLWSSTLTAICHGTDAARLRIEIAVQNCR